MNPSDLKLKLQPHCEIQKSFNKIRFKCPIISPTFLLLVVQEILNDKIRIDNALLINFKYSY